MRMYVGLMVLLSGLTGFLLLLGTNALTDKHSTMGGLLGAVLVNGIYVWCCLQPALSFLGHSLWRIGCLVLMGCLAFDGDRLDWKRCGIFLLASLSLEDVMATGSFSALLPAAVAVWALSRLCMEDRCTDGLYAPLEITHGERNVKLIALRDTGNTLRDPITGGQVFIIGGCDAERLSGLRADQLRNPLDTLTKERIPGLRLIPYRTLGQPAGMLLAKKYHNVKLGNWEGSALVAFAPERIGGGEGFQALAGGCGV